nr:hypothetical protein [Planctomicrobium piriforme]
MRDQRALFQFGHLANQAFAGTMIPDFAFSRPPEQLCAQIGVFQCCWHFEFLRKRGAAGMAADDDFTDIAMPHRLFDDGQSFAGIAWPVAASELGTSQDQCGAEFMERLQGLLHDGIGAGDPDAPWISAAGLTAVSAIHGMVLEPVDRGSFF